MTSLKMQKRLASDIFGVGEKHVWLDPNHIKEIKEAITRQDILNLIDKGMIKKKEYKGQSRGRARLIHSKKQHGHRRGPGSKKGKKSARLSIDWRIKVRALRNELKSQLSEGKITKKEYRDLYRKVKGNVFHSVSHLRYTIEMEHKKL